MSGKGKVFVGEEAEEDEQPQIIPPKDSPEQLITSPSQTTAMPHVESKKENVKTAEELPAIAFSVKPKT